MLLILLVNFFKTFQIIYVSKSNHQKLIGAIIIVLVNEWFKLNLLSLNFFTIEASHYCWKLQLWKGDMWKWDIWLSYMWKYKYWGGIEGMVWFQTPWYTIKGVPKKSLIANSGNRKEVQKIPKHIFWLILNYMFQILKPLTGI